MKNCLNIKCGGNIKLLYDYGSNYNFNDVNFDCTTNSYSKPKIYRCNKCELKFSELAAALPNKKIEDKYNNVVDNIYIDEIPQREKYFSSLYKKISYNFHKDHSVLEVGSYYGVFGNIIKPNVKKYSGLELSKHGSDYSKKNYNLEIFNETIEEHSERQLKYDIIVMADVIEHFSNPFKMLEIIERILKPDGLLIFTTYNMDSLYAKITGKNYHWILPMHLFYFSNKTLKNICLENNLKIYKIKNDSRVVSFYYLLNKLTLIFPKLKFLFQYINKIKLLHKININVNLFDLNIYFVKKNKSINTVK
ncbi:class I SAM-dependent methyltransferase [Candidatus Pelagibacter ubique]|nr:class I SAM-dependent methyltransferase [Candidatus Pelagibacter ubique]